MPLLLLLLLLMNGIYYSVLMAMVVNRYSSVLLSVAAVVGFCLMNHVAGCVVGDGQSVVAG